MEPRTPDEFAAIQKYRNSIHLTKEEIIALQRMRNASLLDKDSPVPPGVRQKGFKGLDFFPIDRRYQLKLKIHRYENPEPLQISLSNGERWMR